MQNPLSSKLDLPLELVEEMKGNSHIEISGLTGHGKTLLAISLFNALIDDGWDFTARLEGGATIQRKNGGAKTAQLIDLNGQEMAHEADLVIYTTQWPEKPQLEKGCIHITRYVNGEFFIKTDQNLYAVQNPFLQQYSNAGADDPLSKLLKEHNWVLTHRTQLASDSWCSLRAPDGYVGFIVGNSIKWFTQKVYIGGGHDLSELRALAEEFLNTKDAIVCYRDNP